MNYYLAKCNELNFLICIQSGLWGQNVNRLKNWVPNDRLFLLTENGISGSFEVTSKHFIDSTKVWPDEKKTYQHRVTINPLKILAPENKIPVDDYGIKDEIVKLSEIAVDVKPDYIKTSTGFGISGAKVADINLMKSIVGDSVKIKAAGGIRAWEDCKMMLEAGASRIGTSSGIRIINQFVNK